MKNPNAVAMGKMGGAASAKARTWERLTPEARAERGRKGHEARMANTTPESRRAAVLKSWETRRRKG